MPDPVNTQVHHEVGDEGPAAKAERLAKEKAAAAEQAEAARPEVKEEAPPAKRSHH